MGEDSDFKLLIINQSDKDRIIRVVVAIFSIVIAMVVDSQIVSLIGYLIGGGLLFNAVTGNCYVYRMLGISTCPLPDSE